MPFLEKITEWLLEVTGFFYSLYLEAVDWWSPFNLIAPFFLSLADAFAHLVTYFGKFNDWVDDVADKVKDILSSLDIKKLLKEWLDWAKDAWDWVKDATTNVQGIITAYWDTVSATVQASITTLTAALAALQVAWDTFWTIAFPVWTTHLDNILVKWGVFVVDTLPNLVNTTGLATWWTTRLTDIGGLISTAFTEAAPLWAGWQDFKDRVAEFFTDPVEFIYERFTDWFLGPEE